MVKVDWLKSIVESFHNIFLKEASKTKGEVLKLLGDFT